LNWTTRQFRSHGSGLWRRTQFNPGVLASTIGS